MDQPIKGRRALIASYAAIFWPGAFIFSFPGFLGPHWQEAFQVGKAAVGQTLFFVLAAVGLFMFIIGRNITMSLAFLVGGCAYFLMPILNELVGWCLLAAAVGYAFGTLFGVSAPLAGDCFGLTHFGAILGLVFTAYGFVAGPIGPWLSGLVLDATGGRYEMVFGYLGSFYVISAILIWLTRPPERLSRPSNDKTEKIV